MEPNFNINRPKVSDEEIKQHKDFEKLVKQFKERSLKQAQGDESWWKNKKVRYSAIIAGVTVICTISYFSLFKNNQQKQKQHASTITSGSPPSQNKKVQTPLVNAPSQKLKINYASYKVNNAKGSYIVHPSTSKIKIPKNTFVDKLGKDIIGEVTIEYREFHDMGDIIVAGIPMAHDSDNKRYNLESAGMFDIKGSQDGEPVFIKPDKKIEVELASSNDEKRFNQYFLDTVLKNWRYMKQDVAYAPPTVVKKASGVQINNKPKVDNPKLLALKNQIEVLIPKKIDSVKTVFLKKAEQLFQTKEPLKPMRSNKSRPTFKLDGSYNEFPELSAFNNVVFEVGPENKNYTKEFNEITWSDVKVTQGPVKGKNYILNLSYRNRFEKLIVYPVLTGADFDKAQKNYENKFSDYQALVEKSKENEQRLVVEMQTKQAAYMAELKLKQQEYDRAKIRYLTQQQNELAASLVTLSSQAKASRIFNIAQFGIFNSDCPHAQPTGRSVNPIFVFETEGNFALPDQVYLVDHTNRSVYNLNPQNGFQLSLSPEGVHSICIFKKNKIYLCDKQQFKQTLENGSNKFKIKVLPEASENLVDFKKALEI